MGCHCLFRDIYIYITLCRIYYKSKVKVLHGCSVWEKYRIQERLQYLWNKTPIRDRDGGSEVGTQICSVVHYCSVPKSCPTLCNPMDCSTPSSVSPRVSLDSCPLSRWCYLTVFPSAAPFSFCLQSFPASGAFPVSSLFTSGGQSIGASASASVLPMNIVYHI